MTEEIKDATPVACGCEGENCSHQDQSSKGLLTKWHGNPEIELAFLLALTPLVVLTLFGQIGLI